MKTPRLYFIVLVFTALAAAGQAQAQTTAFTYQGTLTDGGAPAAGLHDFEFKLYDAASGGTQQGTAVAREDVSVTGGRFTVTLDFGSTTFSGANRWLEIGVRPGAATGAYTGLSPRQAVSSTPYAIRAAVASTVPAGSVTGSMLADGAVTASKLAPGAVSQLGAPDGSPANAVQVNASGLVGVGTNAPAAGLHITASQNFFNPEQLAVRVDDSDGYTKLNGAWSVAVQGNLAVVAGYLDSGITLLNVANPADPDLLSQFRDGDSGFTNLGGAYGVAMKPNLLAVAASGDDAVTLIDVSDPRNPLKLAELKDGVGGWNALDGATAVAINGTLMVIAAAGDSAVTLADISNPAAPVKRAELKDNVFGFNNLAYPNCVSLAGNLLAVGSQSESSVTLVDVTNPANPVKRAEIRNGAGGYNFYGLQGVALSGNLLAIASGFSVVLVNVSDPASPVKLAELQDDIDADALGGAVGLAFSGNQLAVSAYDDDAVTLFDVSNPATPAVLAVARQGKGGFRHLDGAGGLAFAGPNLFVAGNLSDAVTALQFAPRPAGLATAGWVGIGTTRPSGALHVVGDVIVEEAARIEFNTRRFEAGFESRATGNYSTALGFRSIATGNYSTALNWGTASGTYSTAIGARTLASGSSSTALGASTFAEGVAATAMGDSTAATNYGSTAVGISSTASGRASMSMGESTIAGGTASTAMGLRTSASGGASTSMGESTIAGGTASTAMGLRTSASGGASTAMGDSTIASGALSTAMGEATTASGFASTALGSNARAIHDGTFVWSDRSPSNFDSTAANQFSLRAAGGVRFETGGAGLTVDGKQALLAPAAGQALLLNPVSNDTSLSFGNQTRQMINLFDSTYAIGVQSAAAYFRTAEEFLWYRGGSHSDAFGDPGAGGTQLMRLGSSGNLVIAGTLSSGSDRNIKQGFADVDPREVLEKVVALPVQSWTYKTDTGRRHLGPMAQDFHAAFGLNGDDDKHIATVDADGVALAAIKGLNERIEEQNSALKEQDAALKEQDAALKERDARIAELEKRLSAIEAVLKK